MNNIERHYRLLTIRERLNQIQGELLACEDGMHDHALRAMDTVQKHLISAEVGLRAVTTIEAPEEVFALSLATLPKRGAEIKPFSPLFRP